MQCQRLVWCASVIVIFYKKFSFMFDSLNLNGNFLCSKFYSELTIFLFKNLILENLMPLE